MGGVLKAGDGEKGRRLCQFIFASRGLFFRKTKTLDTAGVALFNG